MTERKDNVTPIRQDNPLDSPESRRRIDRAVRAYKSLVFVEREHDRKEARLHDILGDLRKDEMNEYVARTVAFDSAMNYLEQKRAEKRGEVR